jgi:twinfilin-like protein
MVAFADSAQSVNLSTEALQLNFDAKDLAPVDVAALLPTDKPSFTFYRHGSNGRLYFIFCSPDSANIKERMKHTMAIPGLVNIIAKDNGVHVDQKLEIHDPEELDFEQKDERIGKFRSMYLRNEFTGTESRWEGMEEQQKVLDAVR